ncbi:MAG: DUF4331 domain-containing protein [Chloroflexi bacterium]|nr:MAG: DUF4331 domain-containing protein [Chloroflexota bacterium]TMF98295.1 MAG: DUF4331 domain-containing protein [Chloroflexota bacterium]
MSSHREAPAIAKDPVADSTDLYAFVSPDAPGSVTLIANYIPLEGPDGGPNFFEFGDDVLYAIYVDNDGDAKPDVTYRFRFTTKVSNPNTFLYNTGPISSLDSPNWNRPQFYTVTRSTSRAETVIGDNLACPPCNVGPRSTPQYASLAQSAVQKLSDSHGKVFAGQRQEGFYVDLGSIFDLGALRPFQNLHLIPMAAVAGVNGTKHLSVHSIALQVPISDLTRDGTSTFSGAGDPRAAIGVWTAAYRRKALIRDEGDDVQSGPWVQVSRLGNPLFNEVIVPMSKKDQWNSVPPSADGDFLQYVQHPELARLLPVLYPGVFPNLAAANGSRDDLVAILLTGIPSGIIAGFQNFTGATTADMLRLNMAIAPSSHPSILGLVGGDAAGFPNGRRVADDVVAIELRAIAGVTYPLVNPAFTPDGAAGVIYDVEDPATNTPPVSYLGSFPYLNHPESGYEVPA